jgi:DNA-binding beta-propeller fold protein YncE
MKHSAYIGRVGALAVALGIGAAVATTPGIALAQDGDSGSTAAGTESPSNPPSNPPDSQSSGTDAGAPGGTGGGNTTPPDMNVSADTTDTSTHDDDTGASVNEGEDGAVGNETDGPDIKNPTADQGGGTENALTAPAGTGSPAAGRGSDKEEPQQQNAEGPQPHSSDINDKADTAGSLKLVGETDDNGLGGSNFKTLKTFETTHSGGSVSDNAPAGRLALDDEGDEAQPPAANPIASLISLPFRFVSSILAAVTGAPNTPSGENPLFLGLLAFVRRQFAPFERAFSNHPPTITGAQVDENDDGTFTITVRGTDASDPDGDQLTFSATGGAEGTVEKTSANTFTYTPGADFDGDDTVTLTASDPGGLFGFNRKSATVVVDVVHKSQDPTQPENPLPPTQQEDGTVEQTLQFDPAKVSSVTVAPGSEPKYYTYEESYNEETGEYELHLTPTQAGQLRAALGLDTTDSVGLTVTTTETPTVAPVAMRMMSFAALADTPDYTVELPEIQAGHFQVGDAIETSPHDVEPANSAPAGVVVTDRYAYVMSSHLNLNGGGGTPTVSVIGADPTKADYLQVIKEIPIPGSALLLTQSGDRLYIASGNALQVIDTDGVDPTDEADDNALLDPIQLGSYGAVNPIISPDGKTVYVVNQAQGKLDVVDIDPSHAGTDQDPGTYNTVVTSIDVTDDPVMTDNGDGTKTSTNQFPLSGAFNADGTRLYLVRDIQTYTQDTTTYEISDFHYRGEVVTIDTATNELVGQPVELDGDYGYFASSDGKYLYVPTLTMNGFDPHIGGDISPITGSVNVIDLQDADHPVVVANLPAGNLPVNVAFSPDKSLAYVVDAGKGTVYVIDTVNQEVLDLDPSTPDVVDGLVFDPSPDTKFGINFNIIASSPDGTQLFVSNISDGTVVPLTFVTDTV